MKPFRQKSQGFTLIEVVIAAAVFSVLAALSYSAINTTLSSKETIDQAQERTLELQRAYGLLKNDIRFALLRSVRDELSGVENALIINKSDAFLQLTTVSPGVEGGKLSRVLWSVEDKSLRRKQYRVLDRVEGTASLNRVLIEGEGEAGVDQFEVYVHHKDQAQGNIVRTSIWDKDELPLAIEFSFELSDGKKSSAYSWWFDLPSGF